MANKCLPKSSAAFSRTRVSPGVQRQASFLRKTFDMLSNPANSDCVGWTAAGDGFCIQNLTEFTERVLPRYFRHGNYPSFARQLGLYEFVKQESALPTFTHPHFQRGNRALLREIHRKGVRPRSDLACLLAKVKNVQQEHQALQQTVGLLTGESCLRAEHSQDLQSQLGTLRATEQQLETLLSVFSDRMQHGSRLNLPEGSTKSFISN